MMNQVRLSSPVVITPRLTTKYLKIGLELGENLILRRDSRPQQNYSHLELDTVIGSDLYSQDEYIKQYLLDPDLSFISKIKIGLCYYITGQPELILQLTVFKGYLKKINPFLYMDVFGKDRKDSKKW